MLDKVRCSWVTDDPLYKKYHDQEWGSFDSFFNDRYLFEMLTLEGAQAGLNWLTILRRRHHYRQAFCQFEPEKVASFTEADVKRLLQNKGIIRHRLKIESVIQNSKAILALQASYGSFHRFLWEFFGCKRTINHWQDVEEVPQKTTESMALSKELKGRGFAFVGPIICYSFMQAIGIVDDHIAECFLRQEREEGGGKDDAATD